MACRLALLVLVSVLCVSCSDSDSPTGNGDSNNEDTTAPAAILDLAVDEPATTSLLIAWTAVGNDSMTGIAAFYDLRYSTELLTETSWPDANRAEGEPQPGTPGDRETMRVGGLQSGTTYWLGVRAVDTAGNVSPLGSVVEGATIPALAAGFDIPLGLHWDGSGGRLLVCDNGAEEILSVTLKGEVTSLLQVPGPVTLRPFGPEGLVVSSGQLDSPGGGLFQWRFDTGVDTLVSLEDGLAQITGVIAQNDTTVFFAEALEGRVWRLETGTGELDVHWQLQGIVGGLALDGSANLYAALPSHGSIRVLREETEGELVSPGTLGIPLELLYDEARDLLLVSDAGTNTGGIYRVSLLGEVERVEGVAGPVGGLALDDQGNLYYSTLVSISGEDEGAIAVIPSGKVQP
jgi:sugar lactone lactonase YvrE